MNSLPRTVMGRWGRRALARAGYSVVANAAVPDHKNYDPTHHSASAHVPADAGSVLRRDNPRLLELRKLYDELDWPVSRHSRWGEVLSEAWLNLVYFRGDNPYIWHYRESDRATELKYFILLSYIAGRDHRGLLEILDEDGAFGAFTYEFSGRPKVSRDLLDSTNELLFLDKEIGLLQKPSLRVLDVGAGYGRMAHRVSQAVSGLERYTCVDAIPESTFLSEYYAKFRDLDRVEVVALPDVPALGSEAFDIAFNVHSFSECAGAAIAWWMDLLSEIRVQHLFVVPNEPEGFLTIEMDGSRRDYRQIIEDRGYQLQTEQHVYDDPAVRELLEVFDRFCLFSLCG